MRKLILALAPLLFVGVTLAQTQKPEPKKISKKEEKARKAAQKQEAGRIAWEEATRPPEPGYPASLRPEFVTAARQATLIMDNAFNTIPKSRMEFAIANQNSMQWSATLLGSVQNEGERQVAVVLYEYAQKIPVCQQLAWDSVQNVLALAVYSGGFRNCQREAQRLRATADRTFIRNSAQAQPDASR